MFNLGIFVCCGNGLRVHWLPESHLAWCYSRPGVNWTMVEAMAATMSMEAEEEGAAVEGLVTTVNRVVKRQQRCQKVWWWQQISLIGNISYSLLL
ncbi:hypothetical protein Patl1_35229 [Pistacia atlantica]|uniref:Uncharacterized protein n=1 Tax=Pistacia atlantica TaxID=434234 RepID=A0ACC0ZVR1_9ROSI|nr:hypothetical protein Patl1_35229 [Pistacia atlantica]